MYIHTKQLQATDSLFDNAILKLYGNANKLPETEQSSKKYKAALANFRIKKAKSGR